MANDNCIKNNPRGVCCHNIIKEAINKGLAIKEKIKDDKAYEFKS